MPAHAQAWSEPSSFMSADQAARGSSQPARSGKDDRRLKIVREPKNDDHRKIHHISSPICSGGALALCCEAAAGRIFAARPCHSHSKRGRPS
jgi:hypothetical protein